MKWLATILLVYVAYSFYLLNDSRLVVTFFDVGQGDSVLVKTPQNMHVLIDAGAFPKDLWKHFPFGMCDLDLVVVTHSHEDHYKGIEKIFDECDVGAFVYNGGLNFSKAAAKAFAGDAIRIDGVVDASVLWPPRGFLSANENNNSIVLLMSCGEVKVLFAGDAEAAVLKSLKFPPIDVYKVSHHGSIDAFEPSIKPLVSVISVGRNNSYGHPSPKIVEYLKKFGVVYRTDVDDTVSVAKKCGMK